MDDKCFDIQKRIRVSLEVFKINSSLRFYFYALFILNKFIQNVADIDSVITIICTEAIDLLNSIDYQKLNFQRVLDNLEDFKNNTSMFSEEDRLFYSIYYFFDLFILIDLENKSELSIKVRILFKQYLRDLEGYKCYYDLMPSEHKLNYYLQKFKGEK